MKQDLILAVDLGTTNCKVALVNGACEVIRVDSREIGVSIPKPGWAEQRPEEWWEAVKTGVRRVISDNLAQRVRVIGLTGQMHGLVSLDRERCVIRPCMLWNDQRSASACQRICEAVGGSDRLLELTNNPMLPGYLGGKLLWLRENEPEAYARLSTVLLPKDYLRYRLTGEIGTDVSDASGTGLFDVRSRAWSAALLAALDLPQSIFPQVHESMASGGRVTKQAAEQTGLCPGTPVIAGGGDAVMQLVGSGVGDGNTALVVIGTGGNVSVAVSSFAPNPAALLQFFCHVIPHHYVAMGVTLAAGGSLKWFRDTLGAEENAAARTSHCSAFELLDNEAMASPPGANGLIFAPYLQGERCPYADPNAQGAFLGIGLRTTKGDFIRAVLEGVSMSLKDVFETMRLAGTSPTAIRFSGGGATSPLWRQIQADVFGMEVSTIGRSEDAAVLGAAIVAGVAAGVWRSQAEAASLLRLESVSRPTESATAIYQRLFPVYRHMYCTLKPRFDDLAAFRAANS